MTWRITHPNFTMTGIGITPKVDNDVVVPPIVPPVVPPVVPPPRPPRGPFQWPSDPGPQHLMDPNGERMNARWPIPGRREDDPSGTMYAGFPSVGRPSTALFNAGIIYLGPYTGLRLWAPYPSPDDMLWDIIEGRKT